MGLSFTISAGSRQPVIPRSESRGTHNHISLSQIRDCPNLEGQIPVFVSPRNVVAQLYPWAAERAYILSSAGYSHLSTSRIQFNPEIELKADVTYFLYKQLRHMRRGCAAIISASGIR
jgi:hypothetical protein